MKIVITDRIDLPPAVLDQIKQLPAEVYEDRPASEAAIIERVKDANIITATYIDITPAVIDAAPNLQYIIVPAVGYDCVDHRYAAAKGIKVINCPTHLSRAVAEHAVALLFAVARKVCEAQTALQKGDWQPSGFKGFELAGKQLGLVGYGNVGKQVALIGEGLGMRVCFVNAKSSPSELDDLLARSDVVVLCLPLTESSRHLLNADRLKLMKHNAIIVNVARGAVIDQSALVLALKEGRIAGAGLDVFDGEPLAGSPSPEIIDIAKLPTVVATPHIAHSTVEAAVRLGDELLANITACLDGAPINVVGYPKD